MTSFSIRSRLTLDDWHALRVAYGRRTFERVSVGSRLLRLLPYFLGAMIATWVLDRAAVRFDAEAFLAGVVLAVALIIISSRATVRRSIPDADGMFLSELTHEFSASGIHSQRPGIESHIAWGCIKQITATPQHLFLWTDRYQAVLVPVRDLPEGLTVRARKRNSKRGVSSQCQIWKLYRVRLSRKAQFPLLQIEHRVGGERCRNSCS